MLNASTNTKHQQSTLIRIADNGREEQLSYSGLLQYHQGNALWGLTVAFRALQLASRHLSTTQLWDRQHLRVLSYHPGPGVRDAFEYVTLSISRKCFELADSVRESTRCSSAMRYRWELAVPTASIQLALREDFIPEEFYYLLESEKQAGRQRLDTLKNELSDKLWMEPPEYNFIVTQHHEAQ